MIDAPPPPYSSGISRPASPCAASDFHTAGSHVPVWSRSAAPGATTSVAQRATLSRKDCCSGVIVKSIPGAPRRSPASRRLVTALRASLDSNDKGTLASRFVLAQTPAPRAAEPPPSPRTVLDPWQTDERRALRALTHDFTEREIVPHLSDWERAQEVPRDLHRKAAQAGLLGVGFPEEVGGTGGDAVD